MYKTHLTVAADSLVDKVYNSNLRAPGSSPGTAVHFSHHVTFRAQRKIIISSQNFYMILFSLERRRQISVKQGKM